MWIAHDGCVVWRKDSFQWTDARFVTRVRDWALGAATAAQFKTQSTEAIGHWAGPSKAESGLGVWID